MSVETAIKAVLEADATLLATATGGVWSFDETLREGINRTTTPTAFDSNLIIKPCILVRERSANPDFVLQDDAGQYQSYRSIIELWVYSDASFATIATMKDRCYALLHATQVTGSFAVRWAGDIRNQRDTSLDAFVELSTYQVTSYRSV